MSFPPDVPVLKVTPIAVRKLLVDVMQAITGYKVGRVLVETKADRRPQDGSPYCTLWFKNSEPLVQNDGDYYIDTPDYSSDVNGVQVLDNETLVTVQINFWGDGAYDEALKACQTLQNAQRFFDLWRVIGYAGIDSVQDISVQYGAKIQQRAYFNFDFYVCYGRMYPLEYFKISQWQITEPEHTDPAGEEYTEEFEYSKEAADVPDSRCMS